MPRDYSFLLKSRSAPAHSQPPIQWVHGYFPGLKRPECHVGHSRPCSVEVKNEWSYTSTSPICLHGVDRDNFTFYSPVIPREGIFVVDRGRAWGKQYSPKKQTLIRGFIKELESKRGKSAAENTDREYVSVN